MKGGYQLTANNINYARLLEDRRSHLAQEYETHRANLTKEGETRRANDLNYAAQIYGINANAETQRYSAALNAETQRYSAGLGYSASVYASQTSAFNTQQTIQQQQRALEETSRHNIAGEEQAKYSTNMQAGTSILGSVLNTIKSIGAFGALF